MNTSTRHPSWTDKDWSQARTRLESLSLQELRDLSDRVGIAFAGGSALVRTKEEFILVLDEVPTRDLLRALEEMPQLGATS